MNKIKSEKFLEFVKDISRKNSLCNNIKNNFLKKGVSISDEDLDDIYQESIYVLYNNIGTELTSSKGNALDNFFYGICYRQTLKFLRKQERVDYIDDMSNPILGASQKNGISAKKLNKVLNTISIERGHSQGNMSPDNAFDLTRMKELVHKALGEMAERCRQLLTKYYIEGYNWFEIADYLQLANAETAKSAANRCRRHFQEKYKGLEIYVIEK